MDFIKQLLDSNGSTTILIVIDHASKPSLSLLMTPLILKNSPGHLSFMFVSGAEVHSMHITHVPNGLPCSLIEASGRRRICDIAVDYILLCCIV